MEPAAAHMERPIREYATGDFVQLREAMRVDEALGVIRKRDSAGRALIYFYVADDAGKLIGVLQTRALLVAQPEEKISNLMIRRVIAIPETASVLEACEFFVLHKFLAFPVVDRERHIIGVVDINLFNEEVLGIPTAQKTDDLFQTLGFHISQARLASPLRVFRFRFPWLLVTIAAGTVCAFLAKAHEHTLSHTIEVAFFLTLALALGESVAVQSMAFALETLRVRQAGRWYLNACKREAATALPIAGAAGIVVFGVVWAMGGTAWTAAVIGASLMLAVCSACMLGISIPALLRALKLDLTIAAGPITLAITDIATLLIYLGLTSSLL
ncbi:MAG TPA: magnesium transporter [Chthoniobacteraceae bacterium]|nr:magnesium transporter [Chthoniobacteraceae bacterium]